MKLDWEAKPSEAAIVLMLSSEEASFRFAISIRTSTRWSLIEHPRLFVRGLAQCAVHRVDVRVGDNRGVERRRLLGLTVEPETRTDFRHHTLLS